MYCRHCGAEMEKGASVCPNCGKSGAKRWQMVVAISVAVLVLGALAALLFFGLDLDFLKKDKTPETTTPVANQGAQTPGSTEQTPVEPYESEVDFTGDEETAADKLDAVVATVNGKNLTNRLLQYYFNLEVSNFIRANETYLAQLGFDHTRPLNEQKCYDADMSWEAYFVVKAMTTWQQHEAIRAMAEREGFQLSSEQKAELANLDEESQDDLRANKNMNVYKGALYENVIAEALCKQGCKTCSLRCYRPRGNCSDRCIRSCSIRTCSLRRI